MARCVCWGRPACDRGASNGGGGEGHGDGVGERLCSGLGSVLTVVALTDKSFLGAFMTVNLKN